ncbi:tautomerase family protein [Streptomyces sp. NPDC005373]|uniref:tautomerase family protein n=1 Tax=Streptomyces sp. NPDC005373 TaxID=3156879 RepID=UPI0033B55593
MPIYEVKAKAGTVSPEARAKLVDAITTIHTEETNAPAEFVNVLFHEFAADSMYVAGVPSNPVVVHGQVRAGRPEHVRAAIMQRINDACLEATGADPMSVLVIVEDVPAKWAMEAGHVLPEPNAAEEQAWFAAVRARPA